MRQKNYTALFFLIALLTSCSSSNKKFESFESEAETQMIEFESSMDLVSDRLKSMEVIKLFVEIDKNESLDTLARFLHPDFLYVIHGKKRDKEIFFSVNMERTRIMRKISPNRFYSNYRYSIKGDSIQVKVDISDWLIECYTPKSFEMIQTFLIEGELIKAIVEEEVNDENESQFHDSFDNWANENGYVIRDEKGSILEDEYFNSLRKYCDERKLQSSN